jgi:hypothetical protein
MARALLFPIPLLRLAAQGDPDVITTNQAITPTGVQSVFRGRVYGVTSGATPAEVRMPAGQGAFRLEKQPD